MIKYLRENNFKIFSGSMLKLIAVLAMLTDHFGAVFYNEFSFMTSPIFGTSITLYYILRKIGRLSFPIFCFLAVEGFIHTKNRKKYGASMLIFALISEIPFDLCFMKTYFDFSYQNVFFTLFLGFSVMCILEYVKDDILKFGLALVPVFAAYFLRVDYGMVGVLLIAMLYILKDKRPLAALIAYPFLTGGYAAWCAFLPINMYNEKRGFIKGKYLKYAFYIFYPLHLLLLAIADRFI